MKDNLKVKTIKQNGQITTLDGREIDHGLLLHDCIEHLKECDELETAQEEFGDLADLDWFDLLILAHDCGIDPENFKYIKGGRA